MDYREYCNYVGGGSKVEEEDRLIACLPVVKQVRKLAMAARAKGDKKSYSAYDKVTEILKRAPAVEARPVVHGQWRKTYNCSREWQQAWAYVCDQCGEENGRASYFCPCCGAEMGEHG